MIRVLHTGDLHIGNFPGPEENGENARFKDICICLEEMIVKAKTEHPDVAVIAGDIFHQARVWSDRGLKENQVATAFIRELSEICPVVVMRGTPNHDSEQQFESFKSTFRGISGVHIVTEPGILAFQNINGEKVNVACLPGFDRGYYRAKHPGLSKEEENEVFTRSIAEMIIGLKAQCDTDAYTVLVSHYTITGCNMESGQTAFFSQFEPVVYPDTLQAANFDLVCFGHIHRPQQIEGCKNTFYCGAISALNFNDEGQERGFYIHDIHEEFVISVFKELPTRQYKTIYLDDQDVEKIISNPAELPMDKDYDVEFKVIRVIYDCTDEHNKVFNHAAYEKLLYAAGAFWVQEVTPRKISVSVDKKSMDIDNSPESNLVEYMDSKDIEDNVKRKALGLARYIISEATEKATQVKQTGIFMPISIKVKNYRNYKDEEFTYDSIRFCTINGENGAGKSSLFMDAMRDALFEEPREGDLTGWICNAPEVRSGSISFTFRIGEKTFRVTRTRTKSGKGTLNIAEYVDGEWENRSKEKYKDTQQEIENITGMDSLMLTSCALIMQDQYGVFLGADKEVRMNILGKILGLSIYEDMEKIASEGFTEANREIKKLQDQQQAVLKDLPSMANLEMEISRQENELQKTKEETQDRKQNLEVLKTVLATQNEAQKAVLKLNAKISSLNTEKSLKETNKTIQFAIFQAAQSILDKRAEIEAGIERYKNLLEAEKEYNALISKKDVAYEAFKAAVKSLDAVTEELDDKHAKKQSILLKIEDSKRKISLEDRLRESYARYTDAIENIEKIEAHYESYRDLTAEIVKIEKELIVIRNRISSEAGRYELEIDALEKRTELLENSNCPDIENAKCRFLLDALEAKKKLPEIKAEYKKRSEKNMNELEELETRLAKKKDQLEGHPYDMKALAEYRNAKADAAFGYEEYKKLDSDKKELTLCTERLTEIEEEIAQAIQKRDLIKSEHSLAAETYRKATEDIDKIHYDPEAKEKESHWMEDEKELSLAEEQKKVAMERLAEIKEEILKIDANIAEETAERERVKENLFDLEDLENKVRNIEAEICYLTERERKFAFSIGGLKQQQETAKAAIKQAKQMQEEANKYSLRAAAYDFLKEAFSQDGIPHNIVRSVIPVLEAISTNILGQMSQGKMSVEFALERVLKSNNKKEVATLDIIINDSDTGRLPYMSRSGGERVKAALAVILALSEIMKSKAGVQLGFLFIDEPPFLDDTGTQAYCTALETIQQRYPDTKVMAITHDNAFKARFPQSVTVVKDLEGSHVLMD